MKLSYRTIINARAVSGIYNKPLEKFEWFEIKAQTDDATEILIYDYIGWPFNDAGELVKKLSELRGKDILARINSPGGDIFDAMAIYNALLDHDAKVITRGEAMTASAASIILLAGKEVQAYKNNIMMIHDPWIFIAGDQYDMREAADILAKISDNMVDIYAQQSNVDKTKLRNMLKDETWLTAKEAKENGFIDTILDNKAVKAGFDLSMFANVPDELKSEQTDNPTIRDAEKALREAGFSISKAKALLAGGWQNAEGEEKQCAEIAQLLNQTLEIIGG